VAPTRRAEPRRRTAGGGSRLPRRAALLGALIVIHIAVLFPLASRNGLGVQDLPVADLPVADVPAAAADVSGELAELRGVQGRVDLEPQRDPAPTDGKVEVPERASGRFAVAPLVPAAPGVGRIAPRTAGAERYRVEVERGLPYGAAEFAAAVDATLSDRRSWSGSGSHPLVRVAGDADFRIVLASPATVDRLCAPLKTRGRVSCRNGFDVVINAWRWQRGAESYGSDLAAYRHYVVNHEVGHALGFGHLPCSGPGEPAPVMLQQTVGLQGCLPNPWPTRRE
jgi:hypothetical protein